MATSRFKRRNRTDIIIKGCGGLTDIFDDMTKDNWRINDDEYDYLCCQGENVLDAMLINEKSTITEIKNAINLINITLDKYYGTKS
jgi:hypothetical protein